MKKCTGARPQLSKDDEELRRILNNHQVRKTQIMIETVQAQLNNLTYRDSQVFGMHVVLERCDGNWNTISLISDPVGFFHEYDSICDHGFSSGVVEEAKNSVWLNESVASTSTIVCQAKNIENFVILQVICYCSIGGRYYHEYSSRDQENDGSGEYFSIGVSRKDHLHEHVQRHRVVDRNQRRQAKGKMQRYRTQDD